MTETTLAKPEPKQIEQQPKREIEIVKQQFADLGISSKPLTEKQTDILTKPFSEDDYLIRPTGEIYINHAKYRTRLNEAFGIGGWCLWPVKDPAIKGTLVLCTYYLYAEGRVLAQATAAHEYNPNNRRVDWSDALEAVESDALNRICGKKLGMALQMWDARWCAEFIATHCSKDDKGQWKMNWQIAGNGKGKAIAWATQQPEDFIPPQEDEQIVDALQEPQEGVEYDGTEEGTIAALSARSGTKPPAVKLNDVWFSTFSDSLFAKAKAMKGIPIVLFWKENAKGYKNMVAIEAQR